MAKTTTSCPQCKQPVTADITRLFDISQDPEAKQILLSGAYNLIQCPNCGYRGQVPVPLVYHDPDKELLLTFFPPELINGQNGQNGANPTPYLAGVAKVERRLIPLLKIEALLTADEQIRLERAMTALNDKLYPLEERLVQYRARAGQDLIAQPTGIDSKLGRLLGFASMGDGPPTQGQRDSVGICCSCLEKIHVLLSCEC